MHILLFSIKPVWFVNNTSVLQLFKSIFLMVVAKHSNQVYCQINYWQNTAISTFPSESIVVLQNLIVT